MRKALVIGAAALILSGCAGMTNRERNVATGAAIGAGAGALIGSASSGPHGGWAGAAIGGATGGLLGYLLTPPETCVVRTRRGNLRRVRC